MKRKLNLTKRRDCYNNHRKNKIRGKMAHVRKTRSPAAPSVHDQPDPDLIHEINTAQENPEAHPPRPQQTPSALHRRQHNHDHSQTPARTAIPPNPDHPRHSQPDVGPPRHSNLDSSARKLTQQ